MFCRLYVCFFCLLLLASRPIQAQELSYGDKMIADYFAAETKKLTKETADRLAAVKSPEDWKKLKAVLRAELFEMLGLDPIPQKTDLKAVVTGKIDHPEFTVENVHFQSKPGLYVTGNLYLPKKRNQKLPTVLYVCGHGRVKRDGISYGNKAYYQHHGSWFARNGYVCLMIDTLQLGEIEGMHHGTYRYKQWWWNARGYSSAGVEAWNCIRALDYLETRPEVNAKKMGVTGRSGGGAYSWWITALDDRIQVAVPVAGITSLHNHVVDGTIEGHCDCMFQVNTYRWDYPLVAALAAPRPLLISNSDKDRIFPLEGVFDVHSKVRPLYNLHKLPRNLGLQITEGPHKDTQELRIHAFHWFNKHLKGDASPPLIEMAATKLFKPEQLRVFKTLPKDEINTKIQSLFTKTAKPTFMPKDKLDWAAQSKKWEKQLQEKCFRGWPKLKPNSLSLKLVSKETKDGLCLTHYQFESQPGILLNLYHLKSNSQKEAAKKASTVSLGVVPQAEWEQFVSTIKVIFPKKFSQFQSIQPDTIGYQKIKMSEEVASQHGFFIFAPRGIGATRWNQDAKKRTHIRRRFMQLGQTQDGMQVWDIRRAIQAVRKVKGLESVSIHLKSGKTMAGNTLYASLFEGNLNGVTLESLPSSHQNGPVYLNVLRYLDMPQVVAIAAARCRVTLVNAKKEDWKYTKAISDQLQWPRKRFQIVN